MIENILRKPLHLLILFFLISCAGTVELDEVYVDTSKINIEKIDGNYAVFIQDDSWVMNSESSEMFLAPCAGYKSTTDLKPLFVKTMKDVITSSMSNLEYTQREYSSEELSERGFDALISIKHYEAKSNFTTKTGFFGFTLKTATDVSVEFTVTGKNGETFSKNSASSGMGEDFTISALICSNDKGVQEALASSFPKIAEMGMLYVRTGLESVK
jgi:hypothetical protein